MNDPVYAEKYSKPYPDGERYQRMAKQMVDARHVEDRGGLYLSAMGQAAPFSVGGEIGGFRYPVAHVEQRLGLTGLVGTSAATDEPAPIAFTGLNTGLRLQSPSRVAPFVGAGLFGGYGKYDVLADHDGIDNNDNHRIDERGEVDKQYDFFGAVYPEIGLHAWVDSSTRVTGSAAYFVSTEGRNEDFWMVGISVAWLGRVNQQGDRYVPPTAQDEVHRLPPP